ncbi:serine acetyltransferase [Rhizobium sp. PP-F2F-G36]|nr:serine acetyltransferase [Rhizobium sp. PP-F2F-G36]
MRQRKLSVRSMAEEEARDTGKIIEKFSFVALRNAGIQDVDHYTDAVASACLAANEDLTSSRLRDPAIRNKPIECQLSIHSTFCAVLHYRLANALLRLDQPWDQLQIDAMRLCFSARSLTGVEIHPEARIGARLCIDHGWGTVIGQTAEVGDDAYILNNVILGGRAIGDALDGKRHPTIGDRVQLSSGARILGPVVIGDDCFVGSDVTLTADLPAGSRVVNKPAHAIYAASSPALIGTFSSVGAERCA